MHSVVRVNVAVCAAWWIRCKQVTHYRLLLLWRTSSLHRWCTHCTTWSG